VARIDWARDEAEEARDRLSPNATEIVVGLPSVTTPDVLPAAQTAPGSSRPVRSERCACGCEYLVAMDDAWVIWEPGQFVSGGCVDRFCRCHSDPMRGEAAATGLPAA